MAQIDIGVLIIYAAILVCVGNAFACQLGAWKVRNPNIKFKIAAVVGNFMTLVSMFVLGITCIYYDQYPVFGFFLTFLTPLLGSLSIWLTLIDAAVIGILRDETTRAEMEWVEEFDPEVNVDLREYSSHSSPSQVYMSADVETASESDEEWDALPPRVELDAESTESPPQNSKKTVRWATET
ncbi:uncharacterized protein GGS22DRAFT_189678 [Annulohypoxylon maeteangense]|uniref:uncharacterized protein n=1 Tax=Annulohypoxylon maeteangense TaxID=1927788 RepID=UPI0020089028|nr:uncharacterized protein GGS22DRAFT_189678 [Annulohypoxylon maeteangense]KAI0883712.1 hypothetical protein GGS22DRAFT_189678 [Annulohypoxylon maeteangense]